MPTTTVILGALDGGAEATEALQHDLIVDSWPGHVVQAIIALRAGQEVPESLVTFARVVTDLEGTYEVLHEQGVPARAIRKAFPDAADITSLDGVSAEDALTQSIEHDMTNLKCAAALLTLGEEDVAAAIGFAREASIPVLNLAAALDEPSVDTDDAEDTTEEPEEDAQEAPQAAQAPPFDPPYTTLPQAVQEPAEAVQEDAEEEAVAPVKRGRGRPRKEVVEPETVAYRQDEDGVLTPHGRGRLRRGQTLVHLTPQEVEQARAEGRVDDGEATEEEADVLVVDFVAPDPVPDVPEAVAAVVENDPDLVNRFSFHPASDGYTRERHEAIRRGGLLYAHLVQDEVPQGRERELAITKIEEAVFWANAGIARAR